MKIYDKILLGLAVSVLSSCAVGFTGPKVPISPRYYTRTYGLNTELRPANGRTHFHSDKHSASFTMGPMNVCGGAVAIEEGVVFGYYQKKALFEGTCTVFVGTPDGIMVDVKRYLDSRIKSNDGVSDIQDLGKGNVQIEISCSGYNIKVRKTARELLDLADEILKQYPKARCGDVIHDLRD